MTVIRQQQPTNRSAAQRHQTTQINTPFSLAGLRNDLWRFTSPRISESILASIFTDTLSLMVTRYSQVH